MSLRMTQANRVLFLIWNVFASDGDCALVLEAHISAEIQYTIYGDRSKGPCKQF